MIDGEQLKNIPALQSIQEFSQPLNGFKDIGPVCDIHLGFVFIN